MVEQHTKLFRRFFDHDSIIGLTGDKSAQNPLCRMLEEKTIIVMTAQILVNAIVKKEVKLSQIGLLMVDECHHCQVGVVQ